jgi:hypothetical protein
VGEFEHHGFLGERQTLLRIEELLKEIVKHKQHKGHINMAVTLNPGQSVTETATAVDAAGNPDPNAVISWSDAANSGAVTIVDNGTVAGVSTATATYLAAGVAQLTASGDDPSSPAVATGANNPSAITCSPGVSTGVIAVNIVDGTPA